MSAASDLLGVTQETFTMLKAATAGIDTTTGVAGIDLLSDLMSWVPVDVPFFTTTPRGQGKGATAAIYQAILNTNASQPDGGVPMNEAAAVANVANQWVFSPYAAVGAGGRVTWDAIAQGLDYADVLAVDTLQVINQLLISLEIHQLNAQSYPLPAATAPTVVASTSGGSIGASTAVYVAVAARSGVNWYRGGSGPASATGTATTGTGSTNSVVASEPAIVGAAGYDWYVGSSATSLYYYTTTPVNTVTITSVPTSAQTVPTGYAGLFNAGSAGPSAVPTVDSSYKDFWQNGLVASITGDWSSQPDQAFVSGNQANLVTPGTGVGQGSYYASLDGAQLSVSGAALEQIDAMNRAIYDTWQLTPTRLLMGSQVITDITNAVLDNPQAITFLEPDGRNGRAAALAGGHVATYLNKTVNGKPIKLCLMPYLPPGQIVAVVDEVPFPGANVTSPLQVRTQYDFFRFDYGANRESGVADGGPRYDFEVRSSQAFINRASPMMGVIDNIGAGIA